MSKSRENASPLLKNEIVWRDRYIMLESHGYRLRPRYKPDWKPSWLGSNLPIIYFEDFAPYNRRDTMDAVRISDNRMVFIKRVASNSSELEILRFLSDPQRLRDPDNHTVPLLDEFCDGESPYFTYIVMPFLRKYNYPEFFSVDEVVDFFRQLLVGITYMHDLNVAHRDCSDLNIMMDAHPLFPKGFHPVIKVSDASGTKMAYPKRRRDVKTRYYFIDFGISRKFTPDETKKVVGSWCQDPEVPELSDVRPYDPFFTDVFLLGNVLRRSFLDKYSNLKFLHPLVREMTREEPIFRCTSSEALRILNSIESRQSWYTLRWRLKKKDISRASSLAKDLTSAVLLTGGFIASSIHSAGNCLRRLVQDKD